MTRFKLDINVLTKIKQSPNGESTLATLNRMNEEEQASNRRFAKAKSQYAAYIRNNSTTYLNN